VAVNIDPARHHDHALGIDRLGGSRDIVHNFAILDANVPHLAIDPIDRIVHTAVDNSERFSH
jgi:hypothetical protein